MRNKRFTVDAATVNASVGGGNDIVLDVKQTITITSVTGQTDVRPFYPLEVQLINDCGAAIEFLILTPDEWVEYQIDPSVMFDFVRLPKNATLTDDYAPMNRCLKFIVRATEATATQNLIVEFINYKAAYV